MNKNELSNLKIIPQNYIPLKTVLNSFFEHFLTKVSHMVNYIFNFCGRMRGTIITVIFFLNLRKFHKIRFRYFSKEILMFLIYCILCTIQSILYIHI